MPLLLDAINCLLCLTAPFFTVPLAYPTMVSRFFCSHMVYEIVKGGGGHENF